MCRAWKFSAFGLVALGLVLSAEAHAAPQILGLTAFNDPVPLICEEGTCRAELTAFCLQKRRDDPEPKTPYEIHQGSGVWLELTAADGGKRRVAAADLVDISAKRSFTAVEMTVSRDALAELGAERVAVTVDGGVSLIPVPVPGDPDPFSEREIAYVTTTLRSKADRWLGGDNAKPTAARLVNRLINATPLRGDRLAHGDRRSLWKRVINDDRQQGRSAGVRRAQDMYGACLFRVEVGRYFSLRQCLEVKQDSLMLDMNTRYWSGIDAGS